MEGLPGFQGGYAVPKHVRALVQQFNSMVGPDDHKVRRAMCFALMGSMEKAIRRAGDGDIHGMAEARALAQGLFDVGIEAYAPDHFEDYIQVARLLITPGDMRDDALAFRGLDDILSMRLPLTPSVVH